jgi:TetR/AcrR family transcriptional regulator, fatty acid metabolism regulator protein
LGLREQKKKAKLERLETEGLRIFSEEGFDRASVEQIAAAAGVARGTFYLYFKDKQGLFEALSNRWSLKVVVLLEDVERDLAEATSRQRCLEIYQMMGAGLAVIGLSNRSEILLALRESRRLGEAGEGLRRLEVSLLDKVTGFTEEVVGRGLLELENPRLACTIVYGAVERLFYEVLLDSDLGDVQGVARQTVAIFGRGMGLSS